MNCFIRASRVHFQCDIIIIRPVCNANYYKIRACAKYNLWTAFGHLQGFD